MAFVHAWSLPQEEQSYLREEQKEELCFVHNLYTFKKDIITISDSTLNCFRESPSLSSKHLRLHILESTTMRLGILIPKKYLPLAVSRNSLRRNMRAIFRSQHTNHSLLVRLIGKIEAEKKTINAILIPEWKSLLNQLKQ